MLAKYGKVLLPVAILAAAVAVFIMLFLSRPEPKQVERAATEVLVDVARVVKEDIRIAVRAQGTVTPRTSTTLIAEVSGRIVEVADQFEAGGFFKRGDRLLRIDPRDYTAQLKRAKAAVASARSALATEQGRAEVAYQDWVKYKSSVKRSEAATDLALRKPQLEDAQANLDAALADLEHARDQMDRTTIKAPYDGLFRQKHVDVGQYVSVGTALADTFAVDTAELRLAVPQSKLDYLELPTLADHDIGLEPPVQLFAEIGEQLQRWDARVVRTEGVFDQRSRVLFAVAEVNDPYGLDNPAQAELRIGTFVEATIQGRLINDLVVLPRDILRAGNYVWVIDEQNRLQNRRVSILSTGGTHMYVTSGLNEGERVSLTAISGALPGSKVRIASTVPSDELDGAPETEQEQEQAPVNLAPATPLENNSSSASSYSPTPRPAPPVATQHHTGSNAS